MKRILTGIAMLLMMSFGMAQNDTIGSYINVSAEITDESAEAAQDGAIDVEITNVVEPIQIFWSNGATSEDIDQLSAGLYLLTVIDANQETGVFPFEVMGEFNPNDTVTDMTCYGFYGETMATPYATDYDTGAVDLTVYGGEEPYSYLWSNDETTQDISGLHGGIYTVIVNDANGCEIILYDYVYNLISDSIWNDSIYNDPCNGFYAYAEVTPIIEENGSIDLTVYGGTEPYTFLWSNGETSEDISDLEDGSYFVEINDATGCEYSVQAFVYDMVNDSIPNDTIIDGPCSGFYGSTYVTSVQQINGSIDLSVYGGLEPYTYVWSTGATTQDIFDLEEGSYSVVVNDANGCMFTLEDYIYNFNNDTIQNDTIFDFPCFGFFAMGYPTYTSLEGAADGAIDIEVYGGTAPYSFLWNNEETTEDLSGLEEGFYSVLVEDAAGCETAYMEYIYTSYLDSNIWDFPVDSFETNEVIDSCFQISINTAEINAYEFVDDSVFVTWNIMGEDQELLATFILSYFAELDEAGVYQFEIIFVPCDTRAINVVNSFVDKIYIDPTIVTSITNKTSVHSDLLEIYPNPVNDFANIKIVVKSSSVTTIEMISMNGQIISKDIMIIHKGANDIRMSTSALQKGVYVLKVTDANGQINVKRFVK